MLKELIASGEELNSKETILNYEVTEFKTVTKSYDDFYQYYLFWDFVSRWYKNYDNWLLHRIIQNQDLNESVKIEITDYCRQGSALMNKLHKVFEKKSSQTGQNEPVLNLVQNMIAKINDFCRFVPFLQRFLESCFRSKLEQLKEILFAEMNIENSEFTVQLLLNDDLFKN